MEGYKHMVRSFALNVCRLFGWSWCPKLVAFVEEILGWDEVHGFPHVVRVLRNTLELAGKSSLNVDYEVLIASALVHDVGRPFEKQLGENHAVISARIAPFILARCGFPSEKVDDVCRAVESHSFSLGIKPSSAEGAILSDADKLDAMGAIGIARALIEGHKTRRGIEGTIKHFEEKLLKLIDKLETREARELGEEKHKLMVMFHKMLLEDVMLNLEKH